MATFVVIGHKVCTDRNFSLNDLTGSTGRLDVLLRCVNSTFMLSNDIRRENDLYLVLLGGPDPPRTLHFIGKELKYLNPDERSTAALVKNSLMKNATQGWTGSTPGIYISRKGFADVLAELSGRRMVYLKEEGSRVSDIQLQQEDVFVLGGKDDLTPEEENLIQEWPDKLKISLGPKSLHADHCITITMNTLDF